MYISVAEQRLNCLRVFPRLYEKRRQRVRRL